MSDKCEECNHSHYSQKGSVRWQVSGLRCPSYIKLVLSLWDEGVYVGTPSYRPQTLRHGRCHLKERGVCVWQRDADHEGVIRCSSPDLRPALWAMDRDPMQFFLQQCPTCKGQWVFRHTNRICPNKKCPNKRPWALQIVETCRYYRRPEPVNPATPTKLAANPKKSAPVSAGRMRAQQYRPRQAVYDELRACMAEMAASRGGFRIGPTAHVRLAQLATRRADARMAKIVAAQEAARRLPAAHVSPGRE